MGMADSDRDGGSGNTSGSSSSGSSGGSTGSGRSTNHDGRDTPGAPDAPDGKRGSTMGKDGGVAVGGNRDGKQTPGDPNNSRRQGQHESGSTPQSRARDAMRRFARERSQRAGYGDTYSLAAELAKAEEDATMTPRQRDMAIGAKEQANISGFMGAAGSIFGKALNSVTGLMGIGDIGETAMGKALSASAVPDNPESHYGAAHSRKESENSGLQDAAEGAAAAANPVAGLALGTFNSMINHKNNAFSALGKDIAERDAQRQASQPSQNANRPSGDGMKTTSKGSSVANARAAMQPTQAPSPNYAAPTIDRTRYSGGLLSLAQTI